MAYIPPNPRRMGYIDPIQGPLDGPLYMGSHIHQQLYNFGPTIPAWTGSVCIWISMV